MLKRISQKEQVATNPEKKVLIKASRNLSTLYLCSKQLDSFPTEILELKHLKVLDFGDNNLEYLPLEISKLSSLRVMSI